MELFDQNGCLTEEGLHAVIGGQLDELGRLEAAEHLSYCDKCMDRYTALLTADVLEEPPRSARGAVMGTIWVRLMQNTWGRAAVSCPPAKRCAAGCPKPPRPRSRNSWAGPCRTTNAPPPSRNSWASPLAATAKMERLPL